MNIPSTNRKNIVMDNSCEHLQTTREFKSKLSLMMRFQSMLNSVFIILTSIFICSCVIYLWYRHSFIINNWICKFVNFVLSWRQAQNLTGIEIGIGKNKKLFLEMLKTWSRIYGKIWKICDKIKMVLSFCLMERVIWILFSNGNWINLFTICTNPPESYQ